MNRRHWTVAMAWNEQQVARLKALQADGLSCSQIGAELGCSRNAVIGKLHRLGLSASRPPSAPKPIRRTRAQVHVNNRTTMRLRKSWPQLEEEKMSAEPHRAAEEVHADASPATKRLSEPSQAADLVRAFNEWTPPTTNAPVSKTLFDLGPHDCRYPLGPLMEMAVLFCGAVAVDEKPYCSVHCRVAFVGYGAAPRRVYLREKDVA